MIVRYGTVVPEGFLPIYSVDTEEEARQLLIRTCGKNMTGDFVSKELALEQTLDNLWAFGDRLAQTHKRMVEYAQEEATKQGSLFPEGDSRGPYQDRR